MLTTDEKQIKCTTQNSIDEIKFRNQHSHNDVLSMVGSATPCLWSQSSIWQFALDGYLRECSFRQFACIIFGSSLGRSALSRAPQGGYLSRRSTDSDPQLHERFSLMKPASFLPAQRCAAELVLCNLDWARDMRTSLVLLQCAVEWFAAV